MCIRVEIFSYDKAYETVSGSAELLLILVRSSGSAALASLSDLTARVVLLRRAARSELALALAGVAVCVVHRHILAISEDRLPG